MDQTRFEQLKAQFLSSSAARRLAVQTEEMDADEFEAFLVELSRRRFHRAAARRLQDPPERRSP